MAAELFAAEAFDGAALGAGKGESRVVEEEGGGLFGGGRFGVVDKAKLASEVDEVVEVTVVVGGVDQVAGEDEMEVAIEHGEHVLVGAAAEVFHHFGGEVGGGQLSFRFATGPKAGVGRFRAAQLPFRHRTAPRRFASLRRISGGFFFGGFLGFALGGFGTAGGCLFGLFLVDGANSLIIRCQQVDTMLICKFSVVKIC